MYREIDEERQHMKEMSELERALEEKHNRLSEERPIVAESMRRRGGGFVAALGEALSRADSDNTRRIEEAFPEYWARYLELGMKDRKQK